MKKIATILILAISSNLVIGQNLKPIELVKKVFLDTTFVNEIPKFSTGEFKGKPNSKSLAANTNLDFELLEENSKTAVVNMTITDSLGKGLDTYIHLKKEGDWKIYAFRALAMTGFLEQMKTEMEKMTDEQIKSFIESGDERIKSKEDFYRELRNVKLTLDLDENIIKHFKENQEDFQKIIREILSVKIEKEDNEMRQLNVGKYLETDYKELLISNITTSFYCENCYEFTIGGMVDNSVGYFYIPNKEDVPKMNASRLIMIREIGNGWYLFKTT